MNEQRASMESNLIVRSEQKFLTGNIMVGGRALGTVTFFLKIYLCLKRALSSVLVPLG